MSQDFRADLHVDTLSLLAERGGGLAPRRTDFQVDSERCQMGRIDLLGTAIFTVDGHESPWEHCLSLLEARDRLHQDSREPFQIVTHPEQVSDLPDGVVGMLTTIENGIALEGEVQRLETLNERGVRILGLVWNAANELGQGCHEDTGEGLTQLGKEMVKEATSLGWAIDISHLNPQGVLDLCELDATIVATHSNSRRIHDHVRNLNDETLKSLAAANSLVGVNVFPPFLGGESRVGTFIDHVCHIAGILGEERLALGTDLDGISRTMEGFRDYRDMDTLHAALESEISGLGSTVLGNNFMNFWRGWAV